MTFPTIPTTGNGRILSQNQNNTTATRTFPDLSGLTTNSGDLLVAIVVAYERSAAGATFSGWTGSFAEVADVDGGATTMAVGIATKTSTGSETGTFAVTQAATVTGHCTLFVMSIAGWHGTSAPELTALAVGTTAAADPGALAPSWGADDGLWIAVAANGETNTGQAWTGMGANTPPTNYTDGNSPGIGTDIVGGIESTVAFRQINTSSEDVGTWSTNDLSNARNCALLIAIRPVAATNAQAETATATGTAFDATITAISAVVDEYARPIRWTPWQPWATPVQQLGDRTTPAVAATNAQAETAIATGIADNPTVQIAPTPATATATGVVNDATVTVGTIANAETATATGTANNPSISIQTDAGLALGIGTAYDATVTTPTTADPFQAGLQTAWMFLQPNDASFQLQGDATTVVSGATSANAETATATGIGQDATTKVSPTPATATATGEAFNPTVQTGSFTNAQAETATATGTAYNASGRVATGVQVATATGTADGTGSSVRVNAEQASGTGTANNLSITRAGNPQAGVATATGAAFATSMAVRASAETATALAQALDALITGGEVNAQSTPSITAGRTSIAAVTAGDTSTPSITMAATSVPSVSD